MGLDMYLEKINNLEMFDEIIDHSHDGRIILHACDLRDDDISIDSRELGYWRKSNHIHAWFEDTCCGGDMEDCSYYEVKQYELMDLLDTCEQIAKIGKRINKDASLLQPHETELLEELLPTRSGFFFGSTEYDEWYFDDIEDTINIITPVIARMDEDPDMKVFYTAWW